MRKCYHFGYITTMFLESNIKTFLFLISFVMYPFLFIYNICPFKDLCLMAIVEPKSTLLERRRFSVVPFSWHICTQPKYVYIHDLTPNLILKIKRNGFFTWLQSPKNGREFWTKGRHIHFIVILFVPWGKYICSNIKWNFTVSSI